MLSPRLAKLLGAVSFSLALLAPASARAEEVAKSAKYPLWVHYFDAADAPFAATALGAVEDAWQFQVEHLGFPPPPPDGGRFGSDAYDVFVSPTPYNGVCERGERVPGKPGSYASTLTLAPTLPRSAIPLITSHEFHHAIQMGICGDAGNNLAEAGALYISGIHRFGEANQLTYSWGINTFQEHPERSLDWQGKLGDPYTYGSGLFFMFLDQKLGTGDGRVVKKVWDALDARRGDTGCPHYFEGFRAVTDFDGAFREFVRARYFVGPADDHRHLRDLVKWEGGALPQKTLLSVTLAGDHDTLPVEETAPKALPMPYGASYVKLSLAGLAPTEKVRLTFSGDSAVKWSVQTILLPEAGDSTPADEGGVDVDASGSRTMEIAVGRHAALVVAFVNLGDGHYVGDGPGWKPGNLSYAFEKVVAAAPVPRPVPPPGDSGGCAVGTPEAAGWPSGLTVLAAAAVILRRRRGSRGH